MRPADRPIVVAMTAEAREAWGARVLAAGPPMRIATIESIEEGVFDDARMPLARLPAEVLWMTADAFLGPLRPGIERLIAESETLRWVHSVGAGYDMPILQGALACGRRLTVSHVNAIPIAEYVLRTVLDYWHRGELWREAQRNRRLPREDFREIWGSTWLVVGAGAIGCAVAERVRAFQARTIGVRRRPSGAEPVDEMIAPSDIPAALPRADVVVLSAPDTPQTRGLVDAAFLSRMKPDAVLVSVGRASAIDEAALIAALDAGCPEHAILDVHSIEAAWQERKDPMPGSPLWAHPKISLTPHIASVGRGVRLRGVQLLASNLRRYLAGEPLPDEIRPGN